MFNDCTLAINPLLEEPWVGGSFHLLGSSIMELPDGRRIPRQEQQAVINRIDMLGTSFHLTGEQMIRHMAVVVPIRIARDYIGERGARRLEPFLSEETDICAVEPVTTSARLRSLATGLFSPRTAGPARHMRLQGTASLFLSEIIDSYCQVPVDGTDDGTDWQKAGLDAAMERIDQDLGAPLTTDNLAAGTGMAASRLNQLFLRETGMNCSAYIRTKRMIAAQAHLQLGELTVKQVAAAVGYNHVSNFTRAYRERYGETPSRALRRATSR
ncbi:AraC family transcriptional regulator [uncultured Nitratireductor sp.]|uniref:helix-turn-helix transcriptional regulator n=1 Tax=uncultured Nitratireductor sp. TaxID=520953 RepID=UPI0025CCC56A|nr:AraC family transcriptional regulator [uncultured Nitratireductor sp.]